MELIFMAGSKKQERTDYCPMDEQGLRVFSKITGGKGSPQNPFQAEISECNFLFREQKLERIHCSGGLSLV
jgi:hypothetical protein